ncbi:MAG: M4 family metallopeptidase [Rhodothermales bacterium]
MRFYNCSGRSSGVFLHAACCLLFIIAFAPEVSGQKRTDLKSEKQIGPAKVPPSYSASLHARIAGKSGLTGAARRIGNALPIPSGSANVSRSFSDGVKVISAGNGTIRWMQGDLGRISGFAAKSASAEQMAGAALDALAPYASVLRLNDPKRELSLTSASIDKLGYVHARFRQTFDGIPLWARDLTVHIRPDGTLYAVNGSYESTPAPVSTKPSLTPDQALGRAVDALKAENRWAPPTGRFATHPEVELVLYPDANSVKPAYTVTVRANFIEYYTYLVDARTGESLKRLAHHCSLLPESRSLAAVTAPEARRAGRSLPAAGPEVAHKLASLPAAGEFRDAVGVDLNGIDRDFRVYEATDGNFYTYWDLPNLGTFEMPGLPEVGGAMTISADYYSYTEDDFEDQLQFVTSTDNVWDDPSVISAHGSMATAYTYFSEQHNRRAIDDADATIYSIVHVNEGGEPMDNAYWNGQYMAYGDGNTHFKPLAGGLDVAAHEMTHGVIEASAGLVYEFQPGALNESFADVFGVLIDDDDLLVGEDVMLEGMGTALRSVEQPDDPDVLAPQPAHMDQYEVLEAEEDHGGVHSNSGIPNRAAGLVIQALGRETTGQIYYRALTAYMSQRSQFGDARVALVQSAEEIYGAGSAEVTAVNEAFDAVGIETTTDGARDPEGNEVDPVEGTDILAFLSVDGRIGLMDLETEKITFLDPTIVRPSSTTQLSIARAGSELFFVNEDFVASYVDLSTYDVFEIDAVQVDEAGDAWNAVISPDGQYLAFSSIYDEDPTLYFYDGEEVFSQELLASTTQDSVLDRSIAYPDAIAWSPNMENPEIAFDALRRIVVASDTVEYWSIFRINLESEQIINLVPAQGSSLDVANITFGSTDPDLYAYNISNSETGDIGVMVVNSETGEELYISSLMDGIDAPVRPYFSPTDEAILFADANSGLLQGFGFEDWSVESLDVGVGAFNPIWFRLEGSTVAAEDDRALPSMVSLHPNYPNPFNPGTRITFDLPRQSHVAVRIYDLIGREIALLVDRPFASGTHSVEWQAGDLPSGLYMVSLEAGGVTTTRMAHLLK